MRELKKLIDKSGYKLSYIASELNITRYTLSNKINGVTEFKRSEIKKLCSILNLKQSDIPKIFFDKQ